MTVFFNDLPSFYLLFPMEGGLCLFVCENLPTQGTLAAQVPLYSRSIEEIGEGEELESQES